MTPSAATTAFSTMQAMLKHRAYLLAAGYTTAECALALLGALPGRWVAAIARGHPIGERL